MKLLCAFFILVILGVKHAGAACYNGNTFPVCESCTGECGNENGCYCTDAPYAQCIPKDCNLVPNLNKCCPTGYSWSINENCCSNETACYPPCLSEEICELKNNMQTCVCNNSVYENKIIDDLKPNVTCEVNTMSVGFSRCLLEYLGYNPESLRLNGSDPECNTTYREIINNQSIIIIQAPLKKGLCGNVVTNDTVKVYYTNTVNIGNGKIISRNPIHLDFTCSYNLSITATLNISQNIVKKTIYLSPANGVGSYPLTLAVYKDSSYSQGLLSGDTIEIGSYIYLGLVVQYADADTYALMVEECVASPTTDRKDINAITFIKGGKPRDGEITSSVERNGESLEARIRINSFMFNGYAGVYIFCDARLCTKDVDCTKSSSGRSAGGKTQEISIEVKLQDQFYLDSSSSSNRAVSWAVMAGCLFMYLSNKLVW